jgi:23S rRNA (pseudouridine1915-N3)-methyltransferase
MFIKIISIGKLKHDSFQKLANEYQKRLSGFKVEVVELKESKIDVVDRKISEEAELIGKSLESAKSAGYFTVVLDAIGKEMNSTKFAEFMGEIKDLEGGKVCFVIGGSHGLPEEFKSKFDMRLSFGKMTFTHQFVRVLLLEQIYRASTILSGKRYDY